MKSIIPGLLIIAACVPALAQSVGGKTNRIPLDLNKPITPTTLPSIGWVRPSVEFTQAVDNFAEIEAHVESEVPFREITLTVINGENAATRKIPVSQSEKRKQISQRVTLRDGNNVIRIEAVNADGGTVTSERNVKMGKDAIADAVIDINRKDYALLFVTDHYDNWGELVNPIDDGRAIEAILKDKYNFITEVVENATLQEINNKIYDYTARKYNPQDQLFIFFAGHGYYDPTAEEGYIVASNSEKDDRGKSTYLAHTLLRSSLDKIPCNHIFLTMDVCFGGTFDPVLARVRAEDMTDEDADVQYLVNKLTKKTRKYLTSGSKTYVSDGVPGKHSPFAAKFIQALREIGGGGGRLLTLMELNTYFLKLTTEPRFGGFGTDESNSDFVFVARQ
jgi:hypothetical protein